jgi:predicted dinucleotide-binding enzyme
LARGTRRTSRRRRGPRRQARANYATFADAAGFGKIVFNCTAGTASLDSLALAAENALAGKILIDVANPLDSSQGMPPR